MDTAETFAALAYDRLRQLAREKEERDACWDHSLQKSFERVMVALRSAIKRYPYVGPVRDNPCTDSSWWTVQCVPDAQPLTTFAIQGVCGGLATSAPREVVERAGPLLCAFLRDKGFEVQDNPCGSGLWIRLPPMVTVEDCVAGCAS
jgi:hypothetical protein